MPQIMANGIRTIYPPPTGLIQSSAWAPEQEEGQRPHHLECDYIDEDNGLDIQSDKNYQASSSN